MKRKHCRRLFAETIINSPFTRHVDEIKSLFDKMETITIRLFPEKFPEWLNAKGTIWHYQIFFPKNNKQITGSTQLFIFSGKQIKEFQKQPFEMKFPSQTTFTGCGVIILFYM
jgi:hypothetical protein